MHLNMRPLISADSHVEDRRVRGSTKLRRKCEANSRLRCVPLIPKRSMRCASARKYDYPNFGG